MSSKAERSMTPDDFERLREELEGAQLTDKQIVDLALILKDKFQQNGS